MIETGWRHLTVVKSGGTPTGRDAITLPAPMPMSRAPRIAERTLLLYCPWHHEQQRWVSTAAIEEVWSRSFGRKRRRGRPYRNGPPHLTFT
jgi:hypothetical protein